MEHAFDTETAVVREPDGRWVCTLSDRWNIGVTPNGGYAAVPVLRAMRELSGLPDPLSITTHYLRPTTGAAPATVDAELIRRGRTVALTRGSLHQGETQRIESIATFGDLAQPAGDPSKRLDVAMPDLPPPDECTARNQLDQGVELAIASRVDVRIHPDQDPAGGSDDAMVSGWLRLADGRPPDTIALVLFADSFPPPLFARFGRVGWVPTIELTVHVRRRPHPGWIAARFECVDLADGRMIEDGALWDATGALVARSRQLGLLPTSSNSDSVRSAIGPHS